MDAHDGNRVSFLAWMAASSFCVGLLVRVLDRLGVILAPLLVLVLVLVLPPLLYRRLRPQTAVEPSGPAIPAPPRPLVVGAGLDGEEEPHAGV